MLRLVVMFVLGTGQIGCCKPCAPRTVLVPTAPRRSCLAEPVPAALIPGPGDVVPGGSGACPADVETCLTARGAAAMTLTIERFARWMLAAERSCGVRAP